MAESKPEVDSELDNLLDSALNEFDAQKEKEKQVAAHKAETSVDTTKDAKSEGLPGPDIEQMRESLNNFMKENPLFKSNTDDDGELARAMQETLGLFTESLDRFQEQRGDFKTEDFLKDVMSPFCDMLTNGLDNVLTAQLLYPGLKNLHDTMPKWIDENREKVSEDEIKRVESQHDFVKQIIEEYDEEKEEDSKEVKTERQQRILELLSKMQALGDLPPELLGDQEGLDLESLPGLGAEAMPPGCAQQ